MSGPWSNDFPPSFDVGDPNAGHEHFDASGVKFYGPDGVTVLFEFDTATGQLTMQGEVVTDNTGNARTKLGGPGNPYVSFYTGDATETTPGSIGALSGAGVLTTQISSPDKNNSGATSQLDLNDDGTAAGATAVLTARRFFVNRDGGENLPVLRGETIISTATIGAGLQATNVTVNFTQNYTATPHVWPVLRSNAGAAEGATLRILSITTTQVQYRLFVTAPVGVQTSFAVDLAVISPQ